MSQVIESMLKVMGEVRTLSKDQRNRQQNFNFRGIDDVMNVVGPALRNHGIIVAPEVLSFAYDTVEIGTNRTKGGHVVLHMRYNFYAADGSTLPVEGFGEAFDVGDKAASKAASMAYKYALLQALCLPTDEPDADSQVYERSAEPDTAIEEEEKSPDEEVRDNIQDWANQNGRNLKEVAAEFKKDHGVVITKASLDQLNAFYAKLSLGAEEVSTVESEQTELEE